MTTATTAALSLLVLLLVVASPVPVTAEHAAEVRELVNWFVDLPNSVFNPKQEIRREHPDDPSSIIGVFATDDIRKGEVLLSVPWDNIIHAGRTIDDPPPLICETVRNLATEMRKGKKSDFGPYVQYLLAQKVGQLPSAWSDPGQALFREVLSDELPPAEATAWLKEDWRMDCGGSTDPLDENAAMLVVQRAEDDLMMPVYDMYSHRNGWYHNVVNNREEGVRFYLTASRDIAKGEQLYNSYNMCSTCGGRHSSYGTPDIFRDYGFVEQFPQRWIFHERRFAFDLKEKSKDAQEEAGSSEDNIELKFSKNVSLSKETTAFLRKEVMRLERLMKLEKDNTEVEPYEMEKIREYTGALVLAMKLAIKATPGAEDDAACANGDSPVDGSCVAGDGYDALDDEVDDLYYDESDGQYYKPITCDNKEIMQFNDYEDRESLKSVYQTLTFVEKEEIDDVCFDLDDVVQICSSYRPHYHEYNMDYAARYLNDIKRVIFVGGGDSMLLYETLKYPTVEKVVGLELDQKVVRKSFKYFHTQPHFDDERVEWWFGDATKSLLMLPREYFGSFDLVLIDLSETVMSLSVNKKLDVFGALALLLRPGGIMVKNELYLEKFSELFDYTAQIYRPDLPIICDQIVVMGSNAIDFMNADRIDHKVGTKLLEPIDNHPLELFHDYRKTSALEQGKCGDIDEDSDQWESRSGILMVAEVEKTTVPLTPLRKTVANLVQVLKDEGLHPLPSDAMPDDVDPEEDDATVIAMQEGYVAVRVWPKERYCALDIHLWASFNKMEQIRDAMVKALGSDNSSLSSYRIVTGGMQDTATWVEDHKTIGPRMKQTRGCDGVDYVMDGDLSDKSTLHLVLEETLNLVQGDGVLAAVLCGANKDDCSSLDAVSHHSKVEQVVYIPACPDLAASSEYSEEVADIMMECEKVTLRALRTAVSSLDDHIGAFIVDPSAPLSMVKIATSIWSSHSNLDNLLHDHFVFVALMPDHRDSWRPKHNFIDRVRKVLVYDPLFAAELVVSSSDGTMEVGILSADDTEFVIHMDDAVKNIESKSDLNVTVRKVQGALVRFQNDFQPQYFKGGDYDNDNAIDQFNNQKSFGRQSIFQLNIDGNGSTSSGAIKEALDHTISGMEYTATEDVVTVADGIGKGAMVSAIMDEGSVVVVWDGEAHIDINLFTSDETENLATNFMRTFAGQIPGLKLSLRDEQPRGINRVINFAEDYKQTEPSRQKKNRAALSKLQKRESDAAAMDPIDEEEK